MAVWERLVQYVEQEGFERFKGFEGVGTAYFRGDSRGLYAVFLLWEPGASGIRQEDYLRWKRETEEQLYHLYQRVRVWLTLLCAADTALYRDWCKDGRVWLIENWTGRVIRYENQTGSFLGWERSIENALMDRRKEEPVYPVELSRYPIVTISLVVINVVLFCVLELIPQELSATLYSAGVMYWPAVLEEGQYYRMCTSMFLHFGSSHLINNMMILFLIGGRLEKVIGRAKFAAIYFLSGILADLASMGYTMLQNRVVVSAGASGAVFGIVGSLAWIVIANKGRVEGMDGKWMILFVALSLYGGFVNQGTDNAAHLGGFLAGVLSTVLLYQIENSKKKRRQRRG